jgi:hypothetical protein
VLVHQLQVAIYDQQRRRCITTVARGLHHNTISWGDVPTWVVAIATIFAFIAAGFAAVRAKQMFDLEHRRDLHDGEMRRREQASRVSAWVVQAHEQGASPRIALRNASDLPVYSVRYQISTDSHGIGVFGNTIIALPPESEPLTVPLVEVSSDLAENIGVVIEFRDAAGDCWQRNSGGRLSQISEDN